MIRLILIIFLILPLGQIVLAEEIIDFINRGNIDRARELISNRSTAARRDGNLLYFQSLIEKDGSESFKFLEASYKADISAEYLEASVYRMAQYHLAKRDFEKLINTCDAYFQHWENGKYRNEILRMAAHACAQNDLMIKAERHISRLQKENDGLLNGALGNLDEAQLLFDKKDYIQAQKICRNLRKTNYSEAVVPALYMLSHYSLLQKRVDDAILYYNILKEGYPHAVGLDDLIERFGDLTQKSSDNRAEEITGTVYSIQVGVFSVKDNAKAMAKNFEKYGFPVEINEKIISDKNYHVVFVGRFVSSEDAMAFKARLEHTEKEAFHVVAR
ncbi:MAG: SPOR domain-containing protein [Candidatus Zixiibacteriota bacterium]